MQNNSYSNTFSKIYQLQKLIKVQRNQSSACIYPTYIYLFNHILFLVKELKLTLTREITNIYRSIFNNKLKITEFFDKLENNKECTYYITKKFKLQVYTEPILKYIHKHQNCAFQLLCLANNDPIAIQEISSLIINLLPKNIYSTNSLHNEFLIILTRCLLEEVNKLETTGDYKHFLKAKNGTYYLLKTLYTREDIIEYFKQILHFTLTYIDYTERKNKFVFELEQLDKNLEQLEKRRKEEKTRKSLTNTKLSSSMFTDERETMNNTNVFKLCFNLQECISQDVNFHNLTSINIESNSNLLNEDEESNEDIEFFFGAYFGDNALTDKDNTTHSTASTLTFRQFMTEYVPDKKVSDFDKLISETTDPTIIEYLKMRKEIHIKNSSLYSNDSVIDIFYSHQEPNKIFELYGRNFCIVLRLIEEIVIQLKQNIDKIPSIIRFLCKIIEIALKQKFPNIKEYELIPFLGTILFEKIMKPIFFMPHYFGLIDSATLLPETRYNTEIIYKIMEKFYQCELFESKVDCYYTFFNVFFIEKMSIFVNFFRKILSNTKLPEVIEKFINPKKYNFNPDTYIYNYFEDNPSLYQRESLCLYSPKQLLELLKIINSNQTQLFVGDPKTCNVISKGIGILNKNMKEIISTVENSAKQNVQVFKVFRIIDTLPLYDNMENFLDNNIYSKSQGNNNDIILKAKKDFCSCLNNIIDLSQCSSIKRELLNTEELLSILKTISSLSSNNLCNSIYLRWEIHSLKENILNFPLDFKVNDYSLFYSEIEKDLNNNMKNVYTYFSIMADYRETVRYLTKELNGIDNILKSFRRESISKEVVNIIENESVKVVIGLKKESKNCTKLIINPKPDKKKSTLQLCSTIQEFYENFPNLNNHLSHESDIFKKMNEIELLNAFEIYFELIKETLEKIYGDKGLNKFETFFKHEIKQINQTQVCCLDDSFSSETDINIPMCQQNTITLKERTISILFQNLIDYLMEQLYTKLFPNDPTEQDINFYNACEVLSLKKITDIDPTATLDCSDSIISAIECIHRFEKAYSPNEKALQLTTMLNLIKNKIQYIKGGAIAPDEYLPYVWYSIIKAKPKLFCSNMEYLKLFGGKNYDYIYTSINTIEQQIDEFLREDFERVRLFSTKNSSKRSMNNIKNKSQNFHSKNLKDKSSTYY